LLVNFVGDFGVDVNTSTPSTMSYPPQGGYQPAPAGGYPQPGQPGFPVHNCHYISVFQSLSCQFMQRSTGLWSVYDFL